MKRLKIRNIPRHSHKFSHNFQLLLLADVIICPSPHKCYKLPGYVGGRVQ